MSAPFVSMQKGWKATGLLKPLWGRVGGRDGLAKKAGMQPATISGYNTGRLNMTPQAARRIADVLGVSVLELGAPEIQADEQGRSLADRLEGLERSLLELLEDGAAFRREVIARLERLEKRSGTGGHPSIARTAQ